MLPERASVPGIKLGHGVREGSQLTWSGKSVGLASAWGLLDCMYSIFLYPLPSQIHLEVHPNQELPWKLCLLQDVILPMSQLEVGPSSPTRPHRRHLVVWGPNMSRQVWRMTQRIRALQSLWLLKNSYIFERRAQLKPCKPKGTSSPFLTPTKLLYVMFLSLIFVLYFGMSIKHLLVAMLRIEPRTSHVLGKCSTPELCPLRL